MAPRRRISRRTDPRSDPGSARLPPPSRPGTAETLAIDIDKERCQQGSRIVSAASASLRPRLAFAWRQASIPLPTIATTPGHSGLDLSAPMFAPCLLGCPGTGRQAPVLTSLRLARLRYSSACHNVPVTQVFKKVPLTSGLLIRGFGVQVPGGAPGVTDRTVGVVPTELHR